MKMVPHQNKTHSAAASQRWVDSLSLFKERRAIALITEIAWRASPYG